MSVQVQIEKEEHNMAKLTITAPAETFERGITSAYIKMKSQISIPGFRKGKVPQNMVEKMYGPEMFYEEATNIVLPGTYEEAMEQVKDQIHITSQPKIELVQIGKGKDFIYTAQVALMPEATLGQYKGIEVEKEAVAVSDDEVAKELKNVQNKNAREITVDREAKTGDIVNIDYEGRIDGEVFDGGSDKGYSLTLGSGAFIPGFEDALVGIKTGEERDLNLTFPEDYYASDLAGKPVVFHVKANEIKEKELPVLDDEFAQDVSEFDTLEDYKKNIRESLAVNKEDTAKREIQRKVVEKIVENAQMDVPDAMADTQARDMVDRYGQQLQSSGLNLQMYLSMTGMSYEDFVEQMKPQALKNIQNRIVLRAVAKEEGIEVSDEEMDKEYQRLADTYNMELDKIKEILPEEQKDSIRDDILANKALDFVVDNAVVTEVEKAAEEAVEATVDEEEK